MTRLGTIVLACAALLGAAAQAQEKYPSRPITLILSYAPGGSADLIGRAFGKALERHLGQPIVVQNKGGASGAIGNQAVATAAPDGYTMLLASVDIAMNAAVDEVFGRPPTSKPEQFQPIARVAADPNFLAVNAARPWTTLKELVDDARKNPNTIVYTSGGLYGATHLPVEMFLRAAGITMRHLPSAGGGAAMISVLGNHSALLAVYPGVVRPHVLAGKARVLASWGTERSKAFPDVPTFKELGYDIEHLIWWALFTPAKVPDEVIRTLRDASRKAASDPEFLQTLERAGSTPAYMDLDEFRPWWDTNSRRLAETVRAMGKPQ